MKLQVIRPGPNQIKKRTEPGGYVLRIYAVPSEELLLERRLPGHLTFTEAAKIGEDDEALAHARAKAVCIVVYDGDTGARLTPIQIRTILDEPD